MLKLYNTLARKKEIFKARAGKKVNLFVCGPTVYDFSHLGHARTYIVFDALAKYLKQEKYNVFYLQNITDIDDKIISRAEKEKTSWQKLTRAFEKEYLKDAKALKITSVSKYARATDHIKEIIRQVEMLLNKGFAYKIKDGIYFDISRFSRYGRLSGRNALQAEDAVSRIDESKNKRNKGDFCLWKFSKPNKPSWSSPTGPGRPGWHIEDTAIAEKYFGPKYDIHGGAEDLIFPHHEAEISQMESISGKRPMARYWLHTGFLTIKGQKMSKSLGNFITIKDFLKKSPARVLRLFILKNHYRSPIDYSEKEIESAKKQLERIDEFITKLKNQKSKVKTTTQNPKVIRETEEKFRKALEDDFNTAKAIGVIFKLIKQGNSLIDKNWLSRKQAKEIMKFLRQADQILGFIFEEKNRSAVPEKIKKLARTREKLRRQKNWAQADIIRKQIESKGYLIKDTGQGYKIKKDC